MTMIDNAGGFGAALAFKGSDVYEEPIISINDNHIYGETEVSDCPEDGTQYCFNITKSGLLMNGITEAGGCVFNGLGKIDCAGVKNMRAINS